MFESLRRIFYPTVVANKVLTIPDDIRSGIIDTNRASLAQVGNWIDEEAFSKSCFQYGVPDFIHDDINKEIGKSVTYTDLMLYLSRKHFEDLRYLEIGVSVGKNFYQIIKAHQKGQFTGFDIEEINPILAHRLSYVKSDNWPTPASSIKKTPSSFKSYMDGAKHVNYLCADVWDEKSWARLEGEKFNLVFSDALHTPQAILFEFEMLVKYNLLADKFIIFWDDLVGKMQHAFYKIIRKYDKVYQIQDIYLLSVNGWIGENEPPHTVGVISNFKI